MYLVLTRKCVITFKNYTSKKHIGKEPLKSKIIGIISNVYLILHIFRRKNKLIICLKSKRESERQKESHAFLIWLRSEMRG